MFHFVVCNDESVNFGELNFVSMDKVLGAENADAGKANKADEDG